MSAPRRALLAQRLLALAAQQCGSGSGGAAATMAAAPARASAAAVLAAAARAPSTAATALLPLAARRAFGSLSGPTLPAPNSNNAISSISSSLARRRALHTSRSAAAAEAEPSSATPKPTPWGQKSPLSFNSMVAGLAVFLGIVAFAQGTADKRVGDMMKKSQQVAGKAAVGGPFKLVDTRGKTFTNRDLLGKFALLYFGFTHCPDICPDELEKVAEAVDEVERTTGAEVVPVFISVDPRRDTPQRVATYVREFHPRMLGLTGSEQAVTEAAKAYRVYFSRTDGGGGSGSSGGGGGGVSNPSAEDSDDYLVDHSIITYLIDPRGEFVTFYGKNFDAKQLADSIAGHVMAWAEKDESFLKTLKCKLPDAAAAEESGGKKK